MDNIWSSMFYRQAVVEASGESHVKSLQPLYGFACVFLKRQVLCPDMLDSGEDDATSVFSM